MKPINLQQGTPEWRRWRMAGLGGSDAGSILAWARKDKELWPYTTAGFLFREKCRQAERETDFAMRRGTRLEPQAREMYCLERSIEAVPMCGEHSQVPWMKASFDGVCRRLDNQGPRWLLEVKAPAWYWHSYALAGVVPPLYMAQCQHLLFVSGLDRLDYVSFNDGQRFEEKDHMAVVTVEPDAERLAELLTAEEMFWRRVLEWRKQKKLPRWRKPNEYRETAVPALP